MLVDSHIGMLTTFEVGELCLVVGLYPARLVYRYRLPATLGAILVLQTILYNLELQSTHSADNLTAVER